MTEPMDIVDRIARYSINGECLLSVYPDDDGEKFYADLRQLIAAYREQREAHRKACDAADDILVRVTAEVGRYVILATDEDMVPMLAETGVVLTGKMFRRLYEATDRAALNQRGE